MIGRGWLSRSEFWRTPPGELWWIMDAHLPPDEVPPAEQTGRLYKMLMNAVEAEAG